MFNLGGKITITRGRKGERPDFYAATIVSDPTLERLNGRLTRVADVIIARQTREDVTILEGPVPHDFAFALPARIAGNEHVELLDGPAGAPYTVQALLQKTTQMTVNFLATRPAAVSEMALDDVEA